jgi:hypothetical protein
MQAVGSVGARMFILSCLLVVADIVICVGPAFAEAQLAWSTPAQIDPQPTPKSDVILNGVSCASPALCVAVDYAGNALISTDPAGGARTWTIADIDGANNISAVSCAPPSLCIAAGDHGNILTSTNPAGGPGAWTVAEVDGKGRGINSVYCSSVSFCIAVDAAGDVLTSTNPTGGAGAWTITPVDLSSEGYMGANDVYAVSCASTSLCVGADFRGNFLTSTNPIGGSGTWAVAPVDKDHAVYSVACPSLSLCVASDWVGDLLTTMNPTGGAGAWTAARVDPDYQVLNGGWHINSVSCPSTLMCVAVDERGNVFASTDPTGGTGAWSMTDVDGVNNLRGVSCPSTSMCIAVDNVGNVVVGVVPPIPPIPLNPFVVRAKISHVGLRALLTHGLPVTIRCSRSCTASIVVRLRASRSRATGLGRVVVGQRMRSSKGTEVGRATVMVAAGKAKTLRVPIRRRLREFSDVTLTTTTTAVYQGGRAVTTNTVKLRR